MSLKPETKLPTVNPPAVQFLKPENTDWLSVSDDNDGKALKSHLLGSLQMQHVSVLCGSGTSLGDVGGPSMDDLWSCCIDNPTTEPVDDKEHISADEVMTVIAFSSKEDRNIEALLSRCEAFLEIHPHELLVEKFVKNSKGVILKKCSEFLDDSDTEQLKAHRTFLHRLSRRRVRDSRLKVFTTNYDVCFETAASKQGLVVVDGFSYSQPRHFDPRFFNYDIVRRSRIGDESSYLEGLFQLYKLHGSVNWERCGVSVRENPNPDAESACLIYPADGKYHQTYIQPHLELMSQFLAMLREPNTCLIAAGFGFNDDHLSEPILAAVETNPHFRLIVVDHEARKQSDSSNKFWSRLKQLSLHSADVWIIQASFQNFAQIIPDLKSLTPAQRLAADIKDVASP